MYITDGGAAVIPVTLPKHGRPSPINLSEPPKKNGRLVLSSRRLSLNLPIFQRQASIQEDGDVPATKSKKSNNDFPLKSLKERRESQLKRRSTVDICSSSGMSNPIFVSVVFVYMCF